MNNISKAGKALGICIYTVLVFEMLYQNENGIIVGGFGFAYKYMIGMLLIALALLVFLVQPNFQRGAAMLRQVYILSLPYVVTVFISMFLWMINFSGFQNITRGFFYVFYQLIAFGAAGAALYLVGKNAVLWYWAAMIAVNIYRIYQVIREFGFSVFWADFMTLLRSFGNETGDAIRELELHDPNFAIGLLLIFFVAYRREQKKSWLCFAVTLLFFLTGLKRIAVAGIVLACLISLLADRIGEKRIRGFLYTIVFVLCAVGVLYPIIIRSGLFEKFMEIAKIDSLGRVEMYNYIEGVYEVGFQYLGQGLGYVSRMMGSLSEEIQEAMLSYGYAAGELHNDILRILIDIGFTGFLIWLFMFTVNRLRMLLKYENMKTAVVFVAAMVYLFITYMTDNTYYYYQTNFTFAITVLWYAAYAEESEKNR